MSVATAQGHGCEGRCRGVAVQNSGYVIRNFHVILLCLSILDRASATSRGYCVDLHPFVQEGQLEYLVQAKLASSRLSSRAAAVEPTSAHPRRCFRTCPTIVPASPLLHPDTVLWDDRYFCGALCFEPSHATEEH